MTHSALVVGASGIVGSATSRLLLDQGWQVAGLARKPAVAEGVTPVWSPTPEALAAHAPADAEHLIVTYSHALDLELCHRLLLRGFGWLGLIGSATKWARFKSRLQALGHQPLAIDRAKFPGKATTATFAFAACKTGHGSQGHRHFRTSCPAPLVKRVTPEREPLRRNGLSHGVFGGSACCSACALRQRFTLALWSSSVSANTCPPVPSATK